MGPTASGKGTLAGRLCSEFNLYHLSLGDWTRKLAAYPICDVSDRINRYVLYGSEIPSAVLQDEYKNGFVPAIVQLYNYQRRGEIPPLKSRMPLLLHKLNNITTQDYRPRAILLDGFPKTLTDAVEARVGFGMSFPATAISVQCSAEVAKERYLKRARPGDTEVKRFEKRYQRHATAQEAIDCFYQQDKKLVVVNGEENAESVYLQALAGLRENSRAGTLMAD
jgi:adenylate kinase family enzyme